MKKMTCKAMGGCCDTEVTGASAEELMNNGKKHVHDTAEGGDADHKAVEERMKVLPEEDHTKWSKDITEKFDTLADA